MSERINKLFSDIHERYDLMNHVFSLGIDVLWRRAAANEAIVDKKSLNIVDVASGTGDLALEMCKIANKKGVGINVTAMDFNKDMLKLARQKADKKKFANIKFDVGDALKMKYSNASFDVLITGFALRNFDSLDEFIRETHRVLVPGGKFVYLDMAMPENPIQKGFFKLYFGVMRFVGKSVDPKAYNWLFDSVSEFDRKSVVRKLQEAKFENVRLKDLVSGVGFIITGEKRAR